MKKRKLIEGEAVQFHVCRSSEGGRPRLGLVIAVDDVEVSFHVEEPEDLLELTSAFFEAYDQFERAYLKEVKRKRTH